MFLTPIHRALMDTDPSAWTVLDFDPTTRRMRVQWHHTHIFQVAPAFAGMALELELDPSQPDGPNAVVCQLSNPELIRTLSACVVPNASQKHILPPESSLSTHLDSAAEVTLEYFLHTLSANFPPGSIDRVERLLTAVVLRLPDSGPDLWTIDARRGRLFPVSATPPAPVPGRKRRLTPLPDGALDIPPDLHRDLRALAHAWMPYRGLSLERGRARVFAARTSHARASLLRHAMSLGIDVP